MNAPLHSLAPPTDAGGQERPDRHRLSDPVSNLIEPENPEGTPGGQPARSRSGELAEHIRNASEKWLVNAPERGWAALILLLCALTVGFTMMWMQRQVLLSLGQVASVTRAVRVPLDLPDAVATERARLAARDRTARVYAVDASRIVALTRMLEDLPGAAGAAETPGDVPLAGRGGKDLGPGEFVALKQVAAEPARAEMWKTAASELGRLLRARPSVAGEDAPDEHESARITLATAGDRFGAGAADLMAVEEPAWRGRAAEMVEEAGFPGPLRACVAERVLDAATREALARSDAELTRVARDDAAARVEPVTVHFAPGQLIYARGDTLSAEQLRLARAENEEYWALARNRLARLHDVAALALALVFVVGMGLSIATYAPQIAFSPRRFALVAGMIAVALAGSCAVALADPRLAWAASSAPAVLVAMTLAVAYDRRVALAVGTTLTILTCVTLDMPAAIATIGLVAVVVSVRSLREVRFRHTLVLATLWGAAAVLVVALTVGVMSRPLLWGAAAQTLYEASAAALTVLLCGFVILGIVPVIERVFGVTTGLTLIELRDPSRPLLRALQQRAPGTYNHSLNVAALAEAAATAIGADALLAYVGALYHDIGKMNKPDYFVENQTLGFNRHERLTPAMSLLVIVGHVKDGVELARSNHAPEAVIHFIESHHGTTLVEYFYQRARKQAEAARADLAAAAKRSESAAGGKRIADGPAPERAVGPRLAPTPGGTANPHSNLMSTGTEAAGLAATLGMSAADGFPPTLGAGISRDPTPPLEIEYRYPGPKPRTREAAILMVCDASESAARAMADHSPARIESMVKAIAHKRLMDGQFDQSHLTLADLTVVIDTVARSLAAIYHPRIAYPEAAPAAAPGAAVSPAIAAKITASEPTVNPGPATSPPGGVGVSAAAASPGVSA
ncbi:hypothetical protein BH11PLA1_BH11PLA1_03590 [soil metagenome]